MSQSVEGSTAGGDIAQTLVLMEGGRRIDAIAEDLADSSLAMWKKEARLRSVSEPGSLSLRWRLTPRLVTATAQRRNAPSNGGADELLDVLGQLPTTRLVILGEPGAGKTALAMIMVLKLFKQRSQGEPVPVLFPLSSYSPKISVREWMIARLLEDHRVLDDIGDRDDVVGQLIDNHVLPVFDGLDEIPEDTRARAIATIDAFAQGSLILTCRGKPYQDAVEDGYEHLRHAVVVEIDQLETSQVIEYIEQNSVEGDGRWEPVFSVLRTAPHGELARALNTPLMAFLARAAYASPVSVPADLLGDEFATHMDVENHLLESFVPSVYDPRFTPPFSASKATGWLRRIARGPRDIRWWQFRSAAVDWIAILVFAGGSFWVFHLAWGPLIALTGAVLVGCGIFGQTELRLNNGWIEIEADTRASATPQASRRRHRALAAAGAGLSGLGVGLLFGIGMSAGIHARPDLTIQCTLTMGLTFALGNLAASAWGGHALSRLWYALTGRLPADIMGFFEDAHRRGVLRQCGAVYQFRHARLQDALNGSRSPAAEHAEPPKPPRPPASRIGRLGKGPAGRITLQGLAIFLPLFFINGTISAGEIDYASGQAPKEIYEQVLVGPPGDQEFYTFLSAWHWSLPPDKQVTTTATVSHAGRLPVSGFGGQIGIKSCPNAELKVSLSVPGSNRILTVASRNGEIPMDQLDKGIPSSISRFTITLRRLDGSPCVATAYWDSPGITADSFFNLRAGLR